MKNSLNKLSSLSTDRTFRTLVLASILITVMGFSRPNKDHGLYPTAYWAKKGSWEKCADMVLAGDSRVLCGLSPVEMKRYFPGMRIYNYGLGSAWYSRPYMDKVEDLLDPKSTDKTIIMGISPHSLTKRDPDSAEFFKIHTLSESDKFIRIHFAALMRFFDPLTFSAALDGTFPSLAESHTERYFYPDGWIAVHKEPRSIKHALIKYAEFYTERLVDPCNVENVLEYVKRWTGQGIKVYGFIPPTCEEMYNLEAAKSGFNQQEFINRFEAAGGMWIDTDPAAYLSFDGSHLRDDAALQLTRDLVAKLVKLQKKNSPLAVKR